MPELSTARRPVCSVPKWSYSPYDCQVHLLIDGEHPSNWLEARCGQRIPPMAGQYERRPSGGQCATCTEIHRVDLGP